MPDRISMLCKRSLHINTVGIPLYFSKSSYLLDIRLPLITYHLPLVKKSALIPVLLYLIYLENVAFFEV